MQIAMIYMYGNDLVAGALMDVPIKFRALRHISSARAAGHVRPTSQDYVVEEWFFHRPHSQLIDIFQ